MLESTPAPVADKACSKCKQLKPFDDFSPRWDGRGDGFHNRCKACLAAVSKANRAAAAKARSRPAPDPAGFRTCRGCSELKPVSEYYAKGGGRLQSRCKPCYNARNRQKYHNDPAARARHKALRDRWRAENPTYMADYYAANREKHIAYVTEYQKKNPVPRDVKRARDREWYARTVEERRAVKAAWVAKNEQLVREARRRAQSRRRARVRSLPVEAYSVEGLLARDGGDCVLCGRVLNLAVEYPHPMALTIEHLECVSWPDSAGDVPSNVGLSHWGCNNARRDKPHPAAARKRAELLAAEAAAS